MKLTSIQFLVVGVFVLMLPFCTTAQEEVLSKSEAIALTLENNYNIAVAGNTVEIAENNADLLNSNYLPSIFGLAGANYSVQDQQTDRDDGQSFELNDARSESYNASLNLEYTLFDGLGRLYNYKSLKENYNLSKLEARETIENTVLQLFSVYYEVARLTENVEILEQTLEISRNRVKRAGYQFDYGQNTKLEVLNAEVDVTNDSINLMNTRQLLQNTKRDLNVVLARNLQAGFAVDTNVTFIPKIQLESYIDLAQENNVRILQSESAITLSEYDIQSSKARFLPTVGLSGSYGWNESISPASAFFGGSTRQTTGWQGGLSLRWNLFDGGTSITQFKNAKIAKDNQELLKQQIELEVERDIANALGNYENLVDVFEIQEQNVITNKNNFERSKERFNLGQITSIEFRQAQINLINAQTNKNLAKYEAKFAELQLLQQIGQLLNIEF
ncbi:TolC family protein [Leeuwenhoekiella blandensis]|uniref:TolC family protein n=1 Tax=Leeuwenhoekiella blandensis TaxID=360293 RepID=UPI002355FBB8|nr:TolC family protein [Leeuwenhoekiella blandensis]|tara:strand:+ start:20466 stop:21803 length:1338 start_codon:yes stop_codon:yes gene_type:complete